MTANDRLMAVAMHYGADADDLLDWYQDDLELVDEMPSRELAVLVEDYLKGKNDIYRREA